MKSYYPLFFILFSIPSIAQTEFSPPGATWHYTYMDRDLLTGVIRFNGYEKIEYDRDTTIDNQVCKILTRQRVGSVAGEIKIINLPDEIIYQQGTEIYKRNNENFNLMVDFSWETNDTLMGENCEFWVDSVYVDTISGLPTKNLLVDHIYELVDKWHFNEKLGLIKPGFFDFDFICYTDARLSSSIRCYEDDNISLVKFESVPCDYFEDVSQIFHPKDLGLEISPNPIQDNIHLQNKGVQQYQLRIFDVNGKLVYQSDERNTPSKNINCSNWNSGIYILRINADGKMATQKLLKLN